MAAAFFNQYANSAKAIAVSAGTEPAEKVHAEVLQVMSEVEINLSGVKPTLLTQPLAADANLIVTMGCGEKCPYVPGIKILDWPLTDPKNLNLSEVRGIRDQIKKMVLDLIANYRWH